MYVRNIYIYIYIYLGRRSVSIRGRYTRTETRVPEYDAKIIYHFPVVLVMLLLGTGRASLRQKGKRERGWSAETREKGKGRLFTHVRYKRNPVSDSIPHPWFKRERERRVARVISTVSNRSVFSTFPGFLSVYFFPLFFSS